MKDGIEIFFQNLGDADSIFVRTWENDIPTNVLIDGGYKKDYPVVREFVLQRLSETASHQIDHLVCSHCHDDHAGGLLELASQAELAIGSAWILDTRGANEVLSLIRKSSMQLSGASSLLARVQASETTRHRLLDTIERNYTSTPIRQPFAGEWIGGLLILSPTPEFFDRQFRKLEEPNQISLLESEITASAAASLFEIRADQAIKPLGAAVGPENEVSTVLAFPRPVAGNEEVFLFTADAGCEAFDDILIRYPTQLKNLRWMQIPHHGSRRNLTESHVDHFAPTTSFISAAGSIKHPSKKLVNRLKTHGSVFSTHYSVSKFSWLRQSSGEVFDLNTTPATPLYEKD